MMRGLTGSTYELMVPVGGQIAPKYAEATGMFNFYNKQKERSLKVVLYSNSYTVGNTRYTNSKFIMVPGHVRRIWSLRGSLYTFANNFEVGENTEKYKESVTGSVFYGVNTKDNKDTVRWGAYGVNKNGSTLYDCYSVISGMVIAAGINSRTITNLWINADGYGRKGNRSQTEWYIDYQLAPVIALRNVVAKDGTEFDMKTASGVKKHTGWRAGMLMRGVRRPFMSFKCEMGQRPGLKQDLMGTFYINCSFGLSIPVKVKPFQYED